jgi:hypothetical protein
MPVAKAFKVPANPAKCADLLYEKREARYALQRQAEELEKQEKQIRDYLIAKLPEKDASGITGAVATVQIEVSTAPQPEDWGKIHAYVKKTGKFELLQRRINTKAVEELWDDGKAVPGVGRVLVKKVSCTKKKTK